MKNLFIVVFLIFVSLSFAQSINQFDANGKRHGIWKKSFENTKTLRYEGEFFHGKEIGLFKFYKNINDKAVLSATKLFNDKSNRVEVTFLSSKGKPISKGSMIGKTYVGKWTYYHKKSDKIMTIENYDDKGKLQGERLVYYKNEQLAEKNFYSNNKLQGKSVWYSEQGKIYKEISYENGELHGLSKTYNPRGQIKVEGNYRRDKKHGIWKYYKNGKLVKETNFTRKSKNPYKKK